MSHSRRPSRGMEVDAQNNQGVWNKAKAWPTDSRPTSRQQDEPASFFAPSYLRNCRHVQRLQRANAERLARWREASAADAAKPVALSTSASHISLGKASTASIQRPAIQDVIERFSPANDDDRLLPLPDKWSEDDRMNGLEILADGTEVRFAGVTKNSDEAASIRADYPMPEECGLFYFEVTVVSRGKDGLIGIGFSAKKASLNRLPGWESESWAYHGDDGNSFACSSGGKAYGPRFSSQDVIGCGMNFRTGNAFFTKNGVYLGTAFCGIKSTRLYPSVGMKKPGEHLRVNFGRSPFVFDIDRMMDQERDSVLRDISRSDVSKLHVPDDEQSLIHKLVAQYLVHEGYVETAKAFAQDLREQKESLSVGKGPVELPSSDEDGHAANRQRIRKSILDGDIDRALKYTATYYPRVLEDERNRDVYFRLRCRKFIEMMRRYSEISAARSSSRLSTSAELLASNGRTDAGVGTNGQPSAAETQMELDEQLHREVSNGDESSAVDDVDMVSSGELLSRSTSTKEDHLLTAALTYGQELQHEFGNDTRPQVMKQLQDLFAIIAYPNPADSPIGQLLDPQRRAQIAEEVNGAILVSLGKPSSAAIEKVCAQTELFLDRVAAKSGGAAAFVNVRKDFLQPPSTRSAWS